MGVGNIIKIMKEVHPESIIMVKVGNFYQEYGRDVYIMSYLFGYQMKTVENNLANCGFPKTALNKVLKELEDNQISYLVLNKSNNYEVEEEEDFKTQNTY